MSAKQKRELTWIGKENRPKLEPGILLEDPGKLHHAKHRLYPVQKSESDVGHKLAPDDKYSLETGRLGNTRRVPWFAGCSPPGSMNHRARKVSGVVWRKPAGK
jgi:hypothetical protein